MEEREQSQVSFAWVNKEQRIVTFCETIGYEKLSFQSQEEKIAYVYRLCEAGYRIL